MNCDQIIWLNCILYLLCNVWFSTIYYNEQICCVQSSKLWACCLFSHTVRMKKKQVLIQRHSIVLHNHQTTQSSIRHFFIAVIHFDVMHYILISIAVYLIRTAHNMYTFILTAFYIHTMNNHITNIIRRHFNEKQILKM